MARDEAELTEEKKIEKEREEKARKLRERELNDYRFVLSRPEGRRLLWNLMDKSGIFRLSFTGDSKTFFREGQRSVGLVIYKNIDDAQPEAMHQMSNEHKSEVMQNQYKGTEEE
jgi:hypothetical protein